MNDVQATVSDDIETVVRVSWTTERATTGYVEFGKSDEQLLVTPSTGEGTEHEVILLGLPAETNAWFHVVASGGGATLTSEDQYVTTGTLPAGLPVLTVEGRAPLDGYVLLPVVASPNAVVVVDSDGEIVWYYQDTDLDWPSFRAVLTTDGEALVANSQKPIPGFRGEGTLMRVPLDGSAAEDLAVEGVSLDFTQLPDGTLAAIATDIREVEGIDVDVIGDRIVEVDPDGNETEVWTSWDALELEADNVTTEGDWTHANALDYSPDDDSYYLTLNKYSAILKIDRATGDVLWQLGGDESDFVEIGGGTPWDVIHQFHFFGDRLLLFDNGYERSESSVVEYEMDYEAMTYQEIDRFASQLFTVTLGNADRLDDGVTQVCWSFNGVYQQFEADQPTWTLGMPIGSAFGYAGWVSSLYAE